MCALAAGLTTFLAAARGDSPLFNTNTTRSASGQFIVSVTPNNSPFYRRPDISTNAEMIRLEAPFLVVSAEHFKSALWRELGLPPGASWSGRIFLTLHSARSLDEPVLIASEPFIQVWNYRLELPDLINRDRYARALSAVLLLELANRQTPVTGHSAEIPAWLVDGLARQIIAADKAKVILSPPKTLDNVAFARLNVNQHNSGSPPAASVWIVSEEKQKNERQRGLDPLADARRVLQNFPALTFDQLSWPNAAQLNGRDDGVYLASAQLFVDELLGLKNGAAKLRTMLAQLPVCQNWQSAFFAAFREDFRRPLDVEKWWALRVVAFAARLPGPQWTPTVSREKLDEILAVPVEIRSASNALPSRAEITLQAAIHDFESSRLTAILQTKLRDLDLVQLRLSPIFAPVAAGYRAALADFLGERQKNNSLRSTPRAGPRRDKADTKALLKKLDALDANRRQVEAALNSRTSHLPGQQ